MGGCVSKPKNFESKILETDDLLTTEVSITPVQVNEAPAIESIEEEAKTFKSEVLNDKVSESKEEEAKIKGSESEKEKAKAEQLKENAMVIDEGEEVKVKEEEESN